MYPPARARLGALELTQSSRYDGRLRGETTTPGQRTRPEVQKMFKWWKTTVRQWKEKACTPATKRVTSLTDVRPTHILKVLDIISTVLQHFVRSFHMLCVRDMMRMRIHSLRNTFASPLTWPGQDEPHFAPHSAEASLLPLHVCMFFPVHGQVMLSYVEEGVKMYMYSVAEERRVIANAYRNTGRCLQVFLCANVVLANLSNSWSYGKEL